MKFRYFYPAIALVITACSGAPDAIAQSSATTARTLTVTGAGEASATPDMALISIGVQTEGPNASAALRGNSSKMRATIDKLKELGVEERDIQTSGLSVNPRYDYDSNQGLPRLIGFTASNTVTARLRDLDKAGDILDQAVQTGANTLNNISFTFSNPQPLYDTARNSAVAKARAQAELLSNAAGVRLGPILSIQDGYVSQPSPRPMMARMEAAFDQSVPLASGESTVTANVTIVYEIQ